MPKFDGDPLEILAPGIPQADETLEQENLEINDENRLIIGALATPGGNKGLDFLLGKAVVTVRKVSDEAAASPPLPAPDPAPAPPFLTPRLDAVRCALR